MLFFHVLRAKQLTVTGVGLGHKKVGDPCCYALLCTPGIVLFTKDRELKEVS